MVVSKAILPITLSYSSFKLFISSDSRDTAASGMKTFVFNYLQKHFNPVVSKIFRVTLLHCVFCPRRIRLHCGNKCEQLGTIQHLGPVKCKCSAPLSSRDFLLPRLSPHSSYHQTASNPQSQSRLSCSRINTCRIVFPYFTV
jgi:hypothetical protein